MNSRSGRPAAPTPRLRVSLGAKLYVGFLFFALAGFCGAAILVDRYVRTSAQAELEDRLSYETTMLGQMTANALFGEIDPSDTSLNAGVRALGEAVHTELAVIAKNGTIVADSDPAPTGASLGPPQYDAPEIREAREGGRGIAVRDGRIWVALAIMREGRQLGFARSSVSIDVVRAHVSDVRRRLAFGALLAVAMAVVLGYGISSRLVRPMRTLFAAARRVGAGDLHHPVPVTSRDEVAEVSMTFNAMLDELRETVAKLDARNRDMRLVLDNVSQGLLTLDRRARISAERSAVLDVWFGPVAEGSTLWDYLARVDARVAETFQCVWEELLEGVMPLDVVLGLLPTRMTAAGRQFELKATLLGDFTDPAAAAGMLLMISDVTARIAAERAEGEQREIAMALERIMKDQHSFAEFLAEAQGMVERLCEGRPPPLSASRRILHTLKGNASIFGLARFASLCHAMEERIVESGAELSESDREEIAAAWRRLAARLRAVLGDRAELRLDVDDEEYEELLRAVADGQPRQELARRIASFRLERAATRVRRFATQARELALRLGKGEIDVVVDADRLRLSAEALAPFWAAFAHVVRNAVDHGFEYPEERARLGKPPRPRLTLSVRRSGDEVIVEAIDDGAGVDWDAVSARAQEAGLAHATRRDLVAALFHEGFSTKRDVSEVSGRGIGLGAARIECERLGGRVDVTSERGRGATFRFSFPSAMVLGRGAIGETGPRGASGEREVLAEEGHGIVGLRTLARTRA